jgi:hypothetical protein
LILSMMTSIDSWFSFLDGAVWKDGRSSSRSDAEVDDCTFLRLFAVIDGGTLRWRVGIVGVGGSSSWTLVESDGGRL